MFAGRIVFAVNYHIFDIKILWVWFVQSRYTDTHLYWFDLFRETVSSREEEIFEYNAGTTAPIETISIIWWVTYCCLREKRNSTFRYISTNIQNINNNVSLIQYFQECWVLCIPWTVLFLSKFPQLNCWFLFRKIFLQFCHGGSSSNSNFKFLLRFALIVGRFCINLSGIFNTIFFQLNSFKPAGQVFETYLLEED